MHRRNFAHMFEALELPGAEVSGAAAMDAWARVENGACARRLSAMAAMLSDRLAEVPAGEREQWCLDNWDFVSAEAAAALNTSLGVASHQLMVARALHERLPRVAEVFATGAVSLRLVNTIVFRTGLIKDPIAMAKVDTELAARLAEWWRLSTAAVERVIDYWVDRYDPYALRRSEVADEARQVTVAAPDGSGVAVLWGTLSTQDAAALDRRLDAMGRAVCGGDPRTADQRRADALGALAAGSDRLPCGCGRPVCTAEATTIGDVVVHVIAEERSLSDDGAAQRGKAEPSRPSGGKPLSRRSFAEQFWQPAPTGPVAAEPGVVIGGGIIPGPMVATIGHGATIRFLVHPGNAPPEAGYTPSRALADFVRCRDLTCRFPGCDRPADEAGIDHTIPYPAGPTQASNLKCLCSEHLLLKTIRVGNGGWQDRQETDGTVVWTSPGGQTYTTHPGSRVPFPALCRPTAPVAPGPDRRTTTQPGQPSDRQPAEGAQTVR